MTSTSSLINRGIIITDLKRFGMFSIVYLAGLLVCLPLELVMLFREAPNTNITIIGAPEGTNIFLNVLQFGSSPQWLFVLIFPILMAVLLFRYLQSGPACDMAHALPIKRRTLLNSHLFSGGVLLLVPLIITAITISVVVMKMGIPGISGADILAWLGNTVILNLVFFLSSVLVGVITGMSSAQAVLSVIFLLFPSAFSYLLFSNIRTLSFGFPYDYYMASTGMLSPVFKMMALSTEPLSSLVLVAYAVTCAVLYALSLVLYKRRQVERAGSMMAFDILRPVFKYGTTFCFMLLAGSYFYSRQNSMLWLFVAYLISAILTYIVCEMLLNKSIQIFNRKAVKGFAAYSLAIILCVAALMYNLGGYQSSLPAVADIQSVYITDYLMVIDDLPAETNTSIYQQYNTTLVGNPLPAYTEAEDIATIHRMNREIIEQRQAIHADYQDMSAMAFDETGQPLNGAQRRTFYLAYRLKDGSCIYRQYLLDTKKFADILKPVYESPNYKYMNNPALRIKPEAVAVISISPLEVGSITRISDPAQVREGVAALQQDIRETSYDDLSNTKPPWAGIDLMISQGEFVGASWTKSGTHFEAWLRNMGLYESCRIMPGRDVAYAIGLRGAFLDESSFESRSDAIRIDDPQQLEEVLRSYSYPAGQSYSVLIRFRNGSFTIGGFTNDTVPQFLASQQPSTPGNGGKP